MQVVQQLASAEYPEEFAVAALERVLGVEVDVAENADGDTDGLSATPWIEPDFSLLRLVLRFDGPVACVRVDAPEPSSFKATVHFCTPRRFLASFAAITDVVRDLNESIRAIAAATSFAVYVSGFDGADLFIGPVRQAVVADKSGAFFLSRVDTRVH